MITKLTKKFVLGQGKKHVMDPLPSLLYCFAVQQNNDHIKQLKKGFALNHILSITNHLKKRTNKQFLKNFYLLFLCITEKCIVRYIEN